MNEQQAIEAGAQLYMDLDKMLISSEEFNSQMRMLHKCTDLTLDVFDMKCYDLSF